MSRFGPPPAHWPAMGALPLPRRRNPSRRGRRVRNDTNGISLSMGPDAVVNAIKASLLQELPPALHPRIEDVFSRYHDQMRQMIIDRAVIVYKDDFLRDVKALIPEVARQSLNLG